MTSIPSTVLHRVNPSRTRFLAAIAAFATFITGCERAGKTSGDGKPFAGYTLIEQLMSNTTDLIDMDGRVVHRWRSKYGHGGGARLLPNGDLLRCGVYPDGKFLGMTFGLCGVVERFDWDGKILWSFTYSEPRATSHHDIEVLPNGNILLAAVEMKGRDEQIQAGRDPARIRQEDLWSDFLMEIKPTGNSGGEVVWKWHVWDHLVQDHDPKRQNHGVVSEHPELIDVNFIETPVPISGSTMKLLQSVGYVGGGQKNPLPRGVSAPDWTHVNALSYKPDTDQILLTVRSLGEIWMLDHSTMTSEAAGHTGGKYGHGGDLLYRWGNAQAYQRGKPSDQKLFGPHDAQWIPAGSPGAGNVLVFNNGDGRRDGDYSSVEEIRLPVSAAGPVKPKDGGAFGPESSAWTYLAEPRESFYSSFLSSAQRLPNGNTLVCSGVPGSVFEIDPSGRTVWRYQASAKFESAAPRGRTSPISQPPRAGEPPQPPGAPGGSSLPLPQLLTVLDSDGDGLIDDAEMGNAPARLRTLDNNSDGRIAIEECFPIPKSPPGGMAPGGPGGGMPPLPPIFTVLDGNGDQGFDAAELDASTVSLKQLDANKDGRLSLEECLPKGAGGPGGPMPGGPGPGGPFASGPPGPPMGGPGGPGSDSGGPPPIPPIITAFGPNREGTISAEAIARAPEILKKLDRDLDGVLSLNECLPMLPGVGPGANPSAGKDMPPFLPPIILVLDANHDTKVDAQEIAMGSASLAKLDANRDGMLSIDESIGGPPAGMPAADGGSGPDAKANIGGLFRARRFGLDYPAFSGRKLAPL